MKLTHRSINHLTEDLRRLIGDLEELLKAIPKDLTEESRKLRDRAEATLDSARDACARLEKRAAATLRETDEAIHEKPYPFIGAAFIGGVALGVLCWRACCAKQDSSPGPDLAQGNIRRGEL